MKQKILEAIYLLRQNDYIVKKFTKDIKKDADECEESNGQKECLGCSCNICAIQ